MRRNLQAGIGGSTGVLAVLASQRTGSTGPWWVGAIALLAGVCLALCGAALVRGGAAWPGWLLVAAAMSWSATSAGLATSGLTRALLVHAILTRDVRGTRRGDQLARAAIVAAYVCAIPAMDDVGWPLLAVLVLALSVPRVAGSWWSAAGVVMALGLRVWVTITGSLTAQQVEFVVVAYAGAVVVIGAGALHAVRVGRPQRRAVISGVAALADGGDDAMIRTALAAALGDPGLTVRVDAEGLSVQSIALERDPALGAAVRDVADLVATNTSLRQELDRVLGEVRESSARILTAEHDQLVALSQRLAIGPLRHLRSVSDLLDGFPAVDDDVVRRLERSELHLTRAEEGLAEVTRNLTPPLESAEDLRNALLRLARDLFLDAAVDVADDVFVSPAIATTVWFVCAEALTNAAKHSGSTRARIQVRLEAGGVTTEVTDAGVGSADPDGSGLRGLRDRVTALGGRLAVTSPTSGGTTVRAEMPV